MPRIMLLLACGALLMAGCEQPGIVTGLVTLDGEPLTTGVITFNPKAGGPTAYGAIGTDGRYELHTGAAAGLAAGEYVVTVAANAAAPAATPESAPAAVSEAESPGADALAIEPPAEGAPTEGAPGGGPPVLPLLTPEKYADLDRTPLRAAIKGGEQTLEFHLTSE
ncbi:MAG: hypothetical protein ACKON7_04915 [Planctomycetaceae bacterium]